MQRMRGLPGRGMRVYVVDGRRKGFGSDLHPLSVKFISVSGCCLACPIYDCRAIQDISSSASETACLP